MSAPFLQAYVCFAAGILAGLSISAPFWTLPAAALCAVASLACSRYRLSLAAQMLFIAVLGLHFVQLQDSQYYRAPLRAFVRAHEMETVRLTGRVLQTPEISDDFWVLRLRVDSVGGTPIGGVARLTLSGESNSYPLAGDEVEVFARFRLPANFGTEGSFDYERYLRKEGLHVLGTVKDAALVRVIRPGQSPATFFSRIRLRLVLQIRKSFSTRDAALLRALWLDDRAALPPDAERALIDAGVFHVVAISGFHVGVVLAIGFLLLRRFVPYRLALIVLGLFLLFYFLLLEGRSSITRSFLLYVSFAFASLRHEKIPWGNALGFAALVQIVANPLELFDAGYHLTYLSTAAIIFLSAPLSRTIRMPRRAYQFVLDFALTAVCVQLVLGPYQAWTFHRLPLAALLANWVAIPVSSVLIALGVILLPLPFLQPLLAPVVHALLSALIDASSLLSGWWLWTCLAPPLAVVCGYYLLLCGVLLLRRIVFRATCGLLAVALLAWLFRPPAPGSAAFRVHVIDVGQGDAILLEYPDRTFDLVDGGGFWNPDALDIGTSVLLPYFSRMGVTRLHHMFLTHAHADHMNGLISLLRYVPVDEVLVTRRPLADAGFQQLCVTVLHDMHSVRAGAVFRHAGVTLTVLAPRDSGNELHVANDDSLVMLGEYQGRRILLTGDAEHQTEERLVRSSLPAVDVLKVPHHGSRTSSTDLLLSAVRPRTAIISVGRNNWFGHPHPQVLRRYAAHHVMLYRTDRVGTVRVTLAAAGVALECFAWR